MRKIFLSLFKHNDCKPLPFHLLNEGKILRYNPFNLNYLTQKIEFIYVTSASKYLND